MKSALRQLLVISAAATAAALLTGIVATGAAQEPGARRGDPAIVSPEVAADHRVTVRLRAPEAKAVTVSGDFGSDVEMRKSADGIWSATIGPLDPEMYVLRSLAANPVRANTQIDLLWIACGKDDTALKGAKTLHQALEQAGVEHTFVETEGAHHWRVWRRYLRDLAPLLFK